MHRHTKGFLQVVLGDFLLVVSTDDDRFSLLTYDVGDFALQRTDACFTSVVVNNFKDYHFRERHIFRFQTVFLQLLRNEMAFCNLVFLLAQITVQVYDFHTVAQGRMYGLKVIRRGDEHHFREVKIQLDEVIVEGVILFWVKDFEQCSLRVAVDVVAAHLVDFVEDEDRVRRLSLLQILNDSARHCADVCLTVSAKF